MLDMKFVRENPDAVKEYFKKKFQDEKLPLVDEVIALDEEARTTKQEADTLRADRNKLSKQIGMLMGQGKKDEAEEVKKQVTVNSERLASLETKETELEERIRKIMMTIPNIIDPSVPIGKDDSQNVEITRYGEPGVPDFEIPYHTEIMESFIGIDLDLTEFFGLLVGNLYLLVVAGPVIALLYIVGTGTGFSQDTTATADSFVVCVLIPKGQIVSLTDAPRVLAGSELAEQHIIELSRHHRVPERYHRAFPIVHRLAILVA